LAAGEQPSATFVSKLKSVSATGHHVDSSLRPSLLERRSWLGVMNFAGLAPEMAKLWYVDGRYAGPCAGLATLFWSKLVGDKDGGSVVEAYELVYRKESDAQRVAGLLLDARRPWDWNYRPFAVARWGRSVVVLEGRPRGLVAFQRVVKHFGAERADAPSGQPWARPCDPDAEPKPTIDGAVTGGAAAPPPSVFALGFSTAGRFAWLEQRRSTDGARTDWALNVTDLVDDRRVTTQKFTVKRDGLIGLCVRHGRELARVLAENAIDGRAGSTLEQPRPSKDPVAVEFRRARVVPEAGHASHDLILRGHTGSKRIASLEETEARPGDSPSLPPKVLGFMRSPFEQRVAVAVARHVPGPNGDRTTVVEFFGGRLDIGWKNE
jgi:hypothetical protein